MRTADPLICHRWQVIFYAYLHRQTSVTNQLKVYIVCGTNYGKKHEETKPIVSFLKIVSYMKKQSIFSETIHKTLCCKLKIHCSMATGSHSSAIDNPVCLIQKMLPAPLLTWWFPEMVVSLSHPFSQDFLLSAELQPQMP